MGRINLWSKTKKKFAQTQAIGAIGVLWDHKWANMDPNRVNLGKNILFGKDFLTFAAFFLSATTKVYNWVAKRNLNLVDAEDFLILTTIVEDGFVYGGGEV